MSPSGVEYLRHILDETDFISECIEDVGREAFLGDEVLKRAVVRSLEIVGEAAKQVPDWIKTKSPSIEWRSMAAIRDRLIHGYFGVDYDIVWDVATNKIPPLRTAVLDLLATLSREPS